jgi:hypothetical protein
MATQSSGAGFLKIMITSECLPSMDQYGMLRINIVETTTNLSRIILLITMALYAITGGAIFRGQVRNANMRNALGNDAEAMLCHNPPSNYDFSTLTKKTAICQISERAVSPSGTFRSHTSSITLPVSFMENKEKRCQTPLSISAPIPFPKNLSRHKVIEIPGFGNGTDVPGCAVSGSNGSLPKFSVTTTVTASPVTPSVSQTNSPISRYPEPNMLSLPEHTTRFSVASNRSAVSNTPSGYGAGLQLTRSRLASITPRFGGHSGPATARTNRGARQYARVALLLYIAMLIVWVPSTVNRAWGIAHINNPVNFSLNVAASVVLPTQGLFNALVFCFVCRVEMIGQIRKLFRKFNGKKPKSARVVKEVDYFDKVTLKQKTRAWDWPLTHDEEKVEETMVEEV